MSAPAVDSLTMLNLLGVGFLVKQIFEFQISSNTTVDLRLTTCRLTIKSRGTQNTITLSRMTVEVVGHGFLGSSKLLIFFPYSVNF